MSDFGTELSRLMAERGVGVRQLARAVFTHHSHIGNLRSGKATPSPKLADLIDTHLGAGGTLAALAVPQTKPLRGSRVAEALAVAVGGEHADAVATDGLADLIGHYAQKSLLRPSRGLSVTSKGTAAYARLASQQMRCLAMLGDTAGMTAARRHAAEALDSLAPTAGRSGVYSVVRADDPPYTATSLFVAGQHKEAAAMTRRIIATAYSSVSGDMPTSYARTLLILALAEVGTGDADEAAAAGTAALSAGRVVWPTMVLAARLDKALTERAVGSSHADDFRAALADAGTRLALPAAHGAEREAQ